MPRSLANSKQYKNLCEVNNKFPSSKIYLYLTILIIFKSDVSTDYLIYIYSYTVINNSSADQSTLCILS